MAFCIVGFGYGHTNNWPLVATVLTIISTLLLLWECLQGAGKSCSDETFLDAARARTGYNAPWIYPVATAPPKYPHVEGTCIPTHRLMVANAATPEAWENEICKGKYLFLHKPTHDEKLLKSRDYPYADHFAGRKRVWENRWQISFKEALTSDVYFGMVMEEYVTMNFAAQGALRFLTAQLRQILRGALYHSCGDNPKEKSGELEKPCFIIPLWAFDQFIVTPEGQKPPDLTDPNFAEMGALRSKGIRDFKKEIESLEIRPGPTYTFSFYGISRLLDVVKWQIVGIPGVTPLDFNMFCGQPPAYIAMYTLTNSDGEEHAEKRHLESRKKHIFHVGFWSSAKRPTKEKLGQLICVEGRRQSFFDRSPATATMKNNWFSVLACCVRGSD